MLIVRVRVMVFNATFKNISAISWQSVLLVEETRVPRVDCQKTVTHAQDIYINLFLLAYWLKCCTGIQYLLDLKLSSHCNLSVQGLFSYVTMGDDSDCEVSKLNYFSNRAALMLKQRFPVINC